MTLLWETIPNDRNKLHDSLTKYHIDVKDFIDDPETIYHIRTAIGVDRELNWIYRDRIMPLVENILKELKSEIDKTND